MVQWLSTILMRVKSIQTHLLYVEITSPRELTNISQSNPMKKSSNTSGIRTVSRLTITVEDISVNYNIASTSKEFDILAVRPTNEKTLQHACTQMDVDIISLDLSVRLPFYLKHSTVGSAISRGVYLEICYAAGLNDTTARRHLLSNAANLVRATRGKGIIVSSEAATILGLRGPYDIVNLATFWGLSQEKGRDTIGENARRVLVKAETRRGVHKGVLRVIEQPEIIPYKRPPPIEQPGSSGEAQAQGSSSKKRMKKTKDSDQRRI